MKTANVSNISTEQAITKKSHFNFNHDNNTTYSWGEVQPLMGKLMLPDSTINVKDEQLIRVAPMVVPTFGRVKIKNIVHFIPCQEIWPNWDAMLSQTKVSRSTIDNSNPSASTYVPKKVPYVNNNLLAAFCLVGAKVNLYVSGAVGSANENTWYCARNTGTWATPAGWATYTTAGRKCLYTILDIANTDNPTTSNITPFNYNGFVYYVRRLIRNHTTGTPIITLTAADVLKIPTISTMTPTALANANGQGYTHSANNEERGTYGSVPDEHVSFDGSDLIWEYDGISGTGITSAERAGNTDVSPVEGIEDTSFDGCKIRLVFKLSSFGKRLRKILIGLNYDVNLDNDDEVSILPLIGYYKAWWDKFAPERYKNFYETNAWKLIQACMSGASGADIVTWLNNTNSSNLKDYFRGFMADLGTLFATEKMDAISAATDKYAGSSNSQSPYQTDRPEIQKSIIAQINEVLNEPTYNTQNADGSTAMKFEEPFNNPETGPIAYNITNYLNKNYSLIKLTQPQVNALKAAYIMMNKTSVAGQCVGEILKYLGYGDYVEECNGKFITQDETTIKISDVIATAATDKASLGQYGGRGMGIGEFKFTYSTNRFGYIYILSCIVPESGYINAPAHENEAINFEKMYNMEYDGLAYEAIQKKSLMGSPLINDGTYRDTFGFLPTYSQWKFMSNKANGDFSLNSRKNYMTPYTLDKMIPIADANVYKIEETNGHAGSTTELCSPTFKYSDLPNAGEDYRYINKYPWNGNYNRIFEAGDDGLEWSVFSPNNNSFLYNSFEYDNFMCHNVFEIDYMAKMKPIEDSYNTYDEEHGAPNNTMKHS